MMFPKGAAVRFTDEAIGCMEVAQAKRFANRTGTVRGYRMGATDPIVDFPKDGRRSPITLFEVRVRSLTAAPPSPKPDRSMK